MIRSRMLLCACVLALSGGSVSGASSSTYPANLPQVASQLDCPVYVPAQLPDGLMADPVGGAMYNAPRHAVSYGFVKTTDPDSVALIITCVRSTPDQAIPDDGRLTRRPNGLLVLDVTRGETRISLASNDPAIGEAELRQIAAGLERLP